MGSVVTVGTQTSKATMAQGWRLYIKSCTSRMKEATVRCQERKSWDLPHSDNAERAQPISQHTVGTALSSDGAYFPSLPRRPLASHTGTQPRSYLEASQAGLPPARESRGRYRSHCPAVGRFLAMPGGCGGSGHNDRPWDGPWLPKGCCYNVKGAPVHDLLTWSL